MSKQKPFSIEEREDATAWDLPFVENPPDDDASQRTNALNRRSDWKYEPPEEEAEISPPTLEEIEAIRQAAQDEGYQEGKTQGHEEGRAAGFEEGKNAGYEEGLELGKAQGLEEGQQQITEQSERFALLADALTEPLSQANDDTRQQLVRLAVSLARAVIRTEIKSSEDVILQALSEGLKALPINETAYQIHMHPDDVSRVTEHFGEETIKTKGWQLIGSPGMEEGGCDITTSQNAVDVSIERRCRDVLDKFLLEQGLDSD